MGIIVLFVIIFVSIKLCFGRLLNLVAKGVTSVTDVLSKVEALLDDFLTILRIQYTGKTLL